MDETWRTRGTPIEHPLALPGWGERSRWGYDPTFECFWAELWPEDGVGPAVMVGVEHLIPTLAALAGAVAEAVELHDGVAYLALTA